MLAHSSELLSCWETQGNLHEILQRKDTGEATNIGTE
jgi:hypothetical protein